MRKKKELEVVRLMIEFYCHKHHKTKHHELCPECEELYKYAEFRRGKCPWGDNKPFCQNCRIHCYKPDMREKIRAVMRYSGPRIVFRHPIIATRHLIESIREKKKLEKEEKKKALENKEMEKVNNDR